MFQADARTDGRRSILIKSLQPGLSGPNKLESTSEDLSLGTSIQKYLPKRANPSSSAAYGRTRSKYLL